MAEQPKKPAGGAFGRYLAENRPALMAEVKGQPITAITKLASIKFKALTDAERAGYQKKYEAAVVVYKSAMEAFEAAGGEKALSKKAKRALKKAGRKAKKDVNKPKSPVGGAYGCYLTKHRQALMKECAGQPITAVSKLAGERWKALSAEDRKPFEADYDGKRKAYTLAMQSYTPPPKEEGDDAEEPPKKVSRADKAQAKKDEKEEAKKAKEDAKEANKTEKEEAKNAKANAKEAKANAKKAKKEAPKKKFAAKVARAMKVAPAMKKPAAGPELPETVVENAKKAGLLAPLKTLVGRQDIIDSGKSPAQCLKALKDSDGLVHPAKRALLG